MQISRMGAWSGGTVVDLAVNKTTVLAATFAGIYRSTDGGQSWKAVGTDLPDWFIQSVALAPMEGQTIALAASHMGWLYRSTDSGETWQIAYGWHGLGIITRLMASPNFAQDGVVFACTEEDGVFKSTDRGRTWTRANFGLLNLSVTSFCFSPTFAQDEVAFAGTDGGGLFRSRNAGRAWRESGTGLPDSAVQSLALSPDFANDGVILAGTEDRGLYRSTDKGKTWSPVAESLSELCINSLYLAPDWNDGGRLLAATDEGLLASTDQGKTWQPMNSGPAYPYVLAPTQEGLLVGAYDEGVYRCADAETWQDSNHDLAAHLPPITCFSDAFERDHTLLMASMEGQAVRSQDAGQTWTPVQDTDLSITLLTSIGKGTKMALLGASEGQVLCSQDSGETWRPVLNTGKDPISALSLCPREATVAAIKDQPAKKQDDGKVMMLAGTAGGQLRLSRDSGRSWKQLTRFEDEMVVALALEMEAGTGVVAYAVTARQQETGKWQLMLRKTPSWEAILSRDADEPVSVLTPLGSKALFCGLGQQVLYIKGDQVTSESTLEGSATVSSLTATPQAALAGTRFGMYRTTDQGHSWEQIGDRIPVVALWLASPDRAYAVSMGGQLWEVDLSS